MRRRVRGGEPFVRLAVSFRNPSADHRLRLHVPLPEPASTSYGEGQFAVTARGLTSEGGGGEHPLPTFPASAFVSAGDATVPLDRVSEYELVDGGRELAVTVLRSVGWLSVNLHPLRCEPAGPQLPTPAAQRVGEMVEVRLGVLPRAGGWDAAGALRAAELFRHDLVARTGTAGVGDPLPTGEAGLSVTGAGVVLSSLRRREGALELREVAMSDAPTVATFAAAGACHDLHGVPQGVPVHAALPAGGEQTLVVVVELGLERDAAALVDRGVEAEEPVAVVDRRGHRHQQVPVAAKYGLAGPVQVAAKETWPASLIDGLRPRKS